MTPPRVVRRLVIAPAVLVIAVTAVTALPLMAVLAAALSPSLPGRWRPLRVLWFVVVYLVVEAVALVAAFALWVASGFGWRIHTAGFQDLHLGLMRTALRRIVRTAQRTFNLRIHRTGPSDAGPAAGQGDAPVLVLCRHAGPGDSFLLIHRLLEAGWRPRIVLKETLQWDPLLDTVLNRLPCEFVGTGARRRSATDGIRALASTLGRGDALVIFPEGGNFTPRRRLASIAHLEEKGDHERAELARRLRHVLAPRPGGTLAAMDAAPDARLLFVAHTGLEDLVTVVDLWRGLPMDREIEVATWAVLPDEIPSDVAGRTALLDRAWERIDAWIVQRRPPGSAPTPSSATRRSGEDHPPG